ncbi:hypothetical protein HDV06_001021 [Boothiomyces sp. JEL0866]|nr:hypothetical protein HDV06_001021 [Boothiomyces sp. JEL0866]
MKIVLLLWAVTAIPFQNVYDRVNSIDMANSKGNWNKRDPISRTSTPFNFQLSCQESVSVDTCNSVNATLQNAGLKISQELIISSPITVLVMFESFCSAPIDNCNLLGGAVVGSSFLAKLDNSDYFMYPQALVRQNTDNLKIVNYDIIARFNSDFDWFFPTSGNTMQGHEFDFEFVAIHEITHGLGFGSSLKEYNSADNIKYLAPPLLFVNNNSFDGFQAISSFDSRIQLGNFSFQNLSSQLQKFKEQSDNYSVVLSQFESSPFLTIGLDFLQFATSPGLTFHTMDNQLIPLVSSSPYVQSTSLSHITPENFQSADFLMVPSFPSGVPLQYFIEKYGNVYGPKTISILTSIGWNTVKENNARHLTVSNSGMDIKPSLAVLILICTI